MDFDYRFILNFFLAMVAISNPIAKVPFWLHAVADEGRSVQVRLAAYYVATAFLIFTLLIWFRGPILEFFGLSISSFKVGGGIVIFLTGYFMLTRGVTYVDVPKLDEQGIKQRARLRFRETLMPLVIPLIAGPGAMSTVLIYSSMSEGLSGNLSATLVIVVVLLLLFLTLIAAEKIQHVLGETTIFVFTRVFGFLLTAISAQLILEGLGEAFPAWRGAGA